MMRKYKLSDVAVVNPKDKLEDLAIRVSFVPMQNVSENGDIDVSQTRLALEVSKGFTSFVDGDVLMAKITPCMENGKGAVATGLCNGRGFGSTEFFVIRPDHTKVRSEWIYYYTTQKQFRLDCEHNMTGSAGQKRVPKAYLENKKIEIPALAEQDDVLAKLGHIKRILTLRQQQLQKLDELVKARFVELFGDAIHNDKGWENDTVEKLCKEIYGGGTPSKSHPEYYEDGDIPWVSSKDMKTDVLTDSQIKINQLGVDNSTARMVPINSVIMVIRSGILKHTLPVAINAVPITVNQDLKVFIPNKRVLTRFLAIQFKMHEKDILSGVRAVTADNIEFNSLKQRELIVPPIELQQEYVTFLEQIDKSKVIDTNIIPRGGFYNGNEFCISK